MRRRKLLANREVRMETLPATLPRGGADWSLDGHMTSRLQPHISAASSNLRSGPHQIFRARCPPNLLGAAINGIEFRELTLCALIGRVHRPPPPRRCPDPPRARGQMRRAVLHLGDLASGSRFETQSVLESFLPLRFRSRRARSSAVGVSKAREPSPSAVPAPRWPPWSRHRPMRSPLISPAWRSAPEPSRRPPRGLRGRRVRLRDSQEWSGPDHGSPVAGTPAAKASPSSATPDRARCRCPR